jgi:two-component system response regulator HydG
VCWTICGLTSGYLSRSAGKEIYVLEDRCIGKGDAACHLVGAPARSGATSADELHFFEPKRLEGVPRRLAAARHRDAQGGRAQAARAPAGAGPRGLAPDVEEPLGIIAKSPPMRQLVDLARRVAKVDSTVLITGESGAGKERIARLVHDESTRAAGPFIAVNCGAITETLLESELFGHVRGAFTGATPTARAVRGGQRRHAAARRGRRGLARHAGQAAAGAAGARGPARRREQEPPRRRARARRHQPRPHGVAGGAFRQDLYYRLKVVELRVPPLRERRDDVLPLARVLLADAPLRMKRKICGLSPAVADQLLRYDWPGNVRELENAMERAVALARGARVELEDLPEEVRQAFPTRPPADGAVRPLEEVEKEYILAALELYRTSSGGNDGKTRTAEQLQHRLGDAVPQAEELRGHVRLEPIPHRRRVE